MTQRLTLRTRPAPGSATVVAAFAGVALVIAAAFLRGSLPVLLLVVPGIALCLPLLWSARPGPVTVIDRGAGRLEQRSATGRVKRAIAFDRIEGVRCDHVTLPAQAPGAKGPTIYRTLLVTGSDPVPVQGFGAPGPARALARTIEDWLAESPAATPGRPG